MTDAPSTNPITADTRPIEINLPGFGGMIGLAVAGPILLGCLVIAVAGAMIVGLFTVGVCFTVLGVFWIYDKLCEWWRARRDVGESQ